MDRRSFITALIGGMTITALGGVTAVQAAAPAAAPPQDTPQDLDAGTAEKLDGADAGFSQYWRRRRFYRRRFYRPRYRRRFYRRYYGPRPFYGPRRRFYRRYW